MPSPPAWLRPLLLATNVLFPALLIGSGFRNPWLFAITGLAHAALFFAVMNPRCQWLGPVVSSFQTTEREVWLTLDDGPDGEATTRLAKALQTRGVPATFFVIGEKLAQQPEVARTLQAYGHTVAHHTQTHPQNTFWCAGPGRVREEVERGLESLRAAGVDPRWFRAPVGHKPPSLHRWLTKNGLRLIGWNAGGRDGLGAAPEKVLRRILANTKPGSIVLLHEGRPHSEETILRVVDELLARGFRFIIPDEAALEG